MKSYRRWSAGYRRIERGGRGCVPCIWSVASPGRTARAAGNGRQGRCPVKLGGKPSTYRWAEGGSAVQKPGDAVATVVVMPTLYTARGISNPRRNWTVPHRAGKVVAQRGNNHLL